MLRTTAAVIAVLVLAGMGYLTLAPVPIDHVIAFNDAGTIVADLQDPSGQYPETMGAIETADRLYIQSLSAKSIAWLSKVETGLRVER